MPETEKLFETYDTYDEFDCENEKSENEKVAVKEEEDSETGLDNVENDG